jgi:hypothetical protein
MTKRSGRQGGLDQLYHIGLLHLHQSGVYRWHDVEWNMADLRISFPKLSVRPDWMFVK